MKHLVVLCTLLMLLAIPVCAQNITLAWDLSTDDALLGAGGGYKIYQSKQAGAYGTTPIATTAPGINTVTFSTGVLGKLYWVATAFMADGTESVYSNEINSTIKPKPPKLNTVQRVAEAVGKAVTRVAGIFKKDKNLRIVE